MSKASEHQWEHSASTHRRRVHKKADGETEYIEEPLTPEEIVAREDEAAASEDMAALMELDLDTMPAGRETLVVIVRILRRIMQ